MPLKKEGDWDLLGLLTANLKRDIEISNLIGLKKLGLKMEGDAKKHMSKQDLNWAALAPFTIAQKARKGLSSHTLIATSTYFQSITSYVKGNTVYAGVRRQVRTVDGKILADIARLHEYGAGRVPKRPLWEPTLRDGIRWFAVKRPHLKALEIRLAKYKVGGGSKEHPGGSSGMI